MQYITKEQKKILTDNGKDDGSWIENYNSKLPHYQYARILYGPMSQFIKYAGKGNKSIQLPHNCIHNYYGFLLNDASYSVMNLLFYPYHSWIDAMVQFKLRRANEPDPNK